MAVAPMAAQAEAGRASAQMDSLAGVFAASAVSQAEVGSIAGYEAFLDTINSDVLSVVALPCASQAAGCVLPLRATEEAVAPVPQTTTTPPPAPRAPVAASGGGGIGALPILLGLAALGGLAYLVLDDDDDDVRSPGG